MRKPYRSKAEREQQDERTAWRRSLADTTPGWLFPEEADLLHATALNATGPLLEIGAYCGKSTVILGDAAELNGTRLWSIDTHRGSPEMQPGASSHNPDLTDPDGAHDTLPAWRATIKAAELEQTVVGVIGSSLTVAEEAPDGWALIFIDAHHGPPVLDDAAAWRPKVAPGGVLLFHDDTIPFVAQAIEQSEGDGFERTDRAGELTVLTRPEG